MTAKVLVVDDEPALLAGVSYALKREQFDVTTVENGADALAQASSHDFDLVILDLMLPDLSGIQVCRRIRSESAVPIIMLTAKGEEVDRVVGLELGADDYLTKPFSMAELVSRIRALLRRRELDRTESRGAVRRLGGLEIDGVRHEVRVDGRPVQLTPSEFRLLAMLAEDPERAFSRRELLTRLWRTEYVGDERACDSHIVNLRRKIEHNPDRPRRIVTVRGVGYKLRAV
jgi:two-component system, OmpR family, alkaline phosphatase synthesis response regulator PhoP